MIKHYDDENVWVCDSCGEECEELYKSYDDENVHICEDCLKADFMDMASDWMADHALDDDDMNDMLREEDEQARLDYEDYLAEQREMEREEERLRGDD